MIGAPSSPAIWAASLGVINPGLQIPGIAGLLHLDRASMIVVPLGAFPSDGLLYFDQTLAAGLPRISIWMQTLVGLRLTNLEVVTIE